MRCLTPRLLAFLSGAAGLHAAAPAVFDIGDYLAPARQIAGDTAAVQRAIDACAAAGGGTVRLPAGRHLVVGTIVLKSHVHLLLEPGSLLQGSPNHSDYTQFAYEPVVFSASPAPKLGVLVYADSAEDVGIAGTGRIDGNDLAYVTEVGPEIYRCPEVRPFLMVLKRCHHVVLRDFALTNSAFWTLRLLGCDDALLDGLRIDGDLRMPNNDGIDIDHSSNVRIRGCDISTGDDCISLKAVPLDEGITQDCESVVITGCNLRSRSSAVAVGCDVGGQIHDILVSDCVIRDSHRGVSVRLSLGGSIQRVLFSNLIIETRIFDSRWWGRGEPIQIESVPWTRESSLGVVRDIRFSHLLCRGENGAVVYADTPGHLENVEFDHVDLTILRPARFAGGQQDLRPTGNEPLPSLPTAGFLLRHAADVRFDHCTVSWGPNPPSYFGACVDAESCPGLDASGVAGAAAHPGAPAQLIR